MGSELNKLDQLVRRSLLRYPMIFATRWDVLRHLYLVIGNGHEWIGGELVDVCEREPFDEAKARAEFFDGIDDMRARFQGLHWDEEDERDDQLRRLRRQFQLDHVDLLVHEKRRHVIAMLSERDLIRTVHVDTSHAFTVPDDAEASFKAGAVEVLNELVPALYLLEQQDQDRGVRAAACRELQRLAPVDTAAMQRLIRDVLGEEAAPDA